MDKYVVIIQLLFQDLMYMNIAISSTVTVQVNWVMYVYIPVSLS